MNLKNLQLNKSYKSLSDDMINDFYLPVLNESVIYKRAVGFFGSSAFYNIAVGLRNIVKNNGLIQLIISPKIEDEDIEAIRLGYKTREQVIESAVLNSIEDPINEFQHKRLNFLANLIADSRLEIKVAFTKTFGMFHDKLGVFIDNEENKVAFSGSMNETVFGQTQNYESIDVFCSWLSEDKDRVEEKVAEFDKIWYNRHEKLDVALFPKVAAERLEKFKKLTIKQLLETHFDETEIDPLRQKEFFKIPEDVNLYPYQQKAIDAWLDKDGRGIFDMATGSGKTFTGLGALAGLSQKFSNNLGVFIVVPYQHLVEQWVEDIRTFGVEPLICYSKYPGWDKKLKDLISDFKLGVIENFCVIVSNASFKLPKMQNEIVKIKKHENICLVVDEAHNAGAEGLQKALSENFKYRLALSATVERHMDEEGTQAIYDFFGEKCITFSLKDAIESGFLTPYHYYPIIVTLNQNELEEYVRLTNLIVKMMAGAKEKKIPEKAKHLLIKRARIVAGAHSKIDALRTAIMPYKDRNNILVYCGATRIDCEDENIDDERQIEAVTKMLGNELNMKVSMFTSKERSDEREMLKRGFAEGISLQALIAIKCLDEGVNIPGIRTAFILASSTNPKEYIQRRGRVLRKAKGKNYAEIFDFIVMPSDIYSSHSIIYDINAELSLVKRELERVNEFMALCENPTASFAIKDQISEFYKTNYIGGKDYGF